MKASTLFALTVAVLIGLGAAIAVKVSGIFNTPEAKAPGKQAPVKVLAASTNLFAGSMLQTNQVHVRELKPEELQQYTENKDKFLPALPASVALRVTKKDIYAGQPLTQDDLEHMAKPVPLADRMLPTMRAISVSVSKDQCAGGLIQVGDWVDILLTCSITDNQGHSVTRTATMAPKVRVLAKRNTLWPVFAPLPEKKPIQFTIEVNPYRAALMEFVKAKGEISLTPLPASAQKELETKRLEIFKQNSPIKQVHFLKDDQQAIREDDLVDKHNSGELVVGNDDLIDLFDLKMATQAPPVAKVVIEQLVGMNHFRPAEFADNGKRLYPTKPGVAPVSPESGDATPSFGFQFSSPTQKCTKCKKKQG